MIDRIQTAATVTMYRVENPKIPTRPNGVTSHEDLVGQWFTPDLDTALGYLRKSTQTFGPNAGPVDGAQIVIAQVPKEKVNDFHVSQNPIAAGMDVEDNILFTTSGWSDRD